MKLQWARQAQSDLLSIDIRSLPGTDLARTAIPKKLREDACPPLASIGRYIAQHDPHAARTWLDRLRARARQAVDHPESGRIVPEYSHPEIRELLVKNYRIVYLLDRGGERIVVLTVFEGHRLLPKLDER